MGEERKKERKKTVVLVRNKELELCGSHGSQSKGYKEAEGKPSSRSKAPGHRKGRMSRREWD